MINPAYMSLPEYSAALTASLSRYGSTAQLVGDDWQPWAAALTSSPRVAACAPPNPYDFRDWRDWGTALAASTHGLMV